MSARAGVRTPRAPKVKPFTPRPGDPGTTLIWRDYRNGQREATHRGEVWSAGPTVGTRWVLCDDGSLALVKYASSGRRAGAVDVIARRDLSWQRRMVHALDTLSRATGLMASDHERPLIGCGGRTVTHTRWHVAGCEHAERRPRSDECQVRLSDGTVRHADTARGWHHFLLNHLTNPYAADRLDLCGCITGEPIEQTEAA